MKAFVLGVVTFISTAGAVLPARGQQSPAASTAVECAPEMSKEQCEAAQLGALRQKMDQAAALTAALDVRAASARNELTYLYAEAIQKAVMRNWLQPDGIPEAKCAVHVIQLPGGMVESAVVDSSCPYNDIGRRSVVGAVLRTQPLPYKGFESVFRRNVTLNFVPWSDDGAHTP